MTQHLVKTFIDALHHLEETGDVEAMAALFTEDAPLGNVAASTSFEGPEGAREFWRIYRANFADIHSEFRRVVVTDDHAALEWDSEGTTLTGGEFRYSGVTLLDFGDGKITRFHAYFDPAAIGAQLGLGGARGRTVQATDEAQPAESDAIA